MGKKILIVEDTRNIRDIVAFMLKNRGYEVLTAEEGNDGLLKATTLKPDLIVLDAMIPNKTGFEICAELKADPKHKNIPVLMLTAITKDSDKSDEYWRVKAGADDLMSKPFKAAELVHRIEKLLGVAPAAGNGPPPG